MMIASSQRACLILLAAAAVQISGPGCVSTDGKPSDSRTKPAVGGVVYQVEAIWESQLMGTFDTKHNGALVPGLAGRVFLFGPDMHKTLRGHGVMTVDLYDAQQPGKDGNPKLLQKWNIDKVSLDQLMRPHVIGWGYTLFLPWPEYDHSVKRVIVQVSYHPVKGTPVFGQRNELTLRNEPMQRTETVVGAGAKK